MIWVDIDQSQSNEHFDHHDMYQYSANEQHDDIESHGSGQGMYMIIIVHNIIMMFSQPFLYI